MKLTKLLAFIFISINSIVIKASEPPSQKPSCIILLSNDSEIKRTARYFKSKNYKILKVYDKKDGFEFRQNAFHSFLTWLKNLSENYTDIVICGHGTLHKHDKSLLILSCKNQRDELVKELIPLPSLHRAIKKIPSLHNKLTILNCFASNSNNHHLFKFSANGSNLVIGDYFIVLPGLNLSNRSNHLEGLPQYEAISALAKKFDYDRKTEEQLSEILPYVESILSFLNELQKSDCSQERTNFLRAQACDGVLPTKIKIGKQVGIYQMHHEPSLRLEKIYPV